MMKMTTKPRFYFSARARILAWMMVLVTFASALTVFVTERILSAGVDSSVSLAISHEATQFHSSTATGDPVTGKPYTNLEDLFAAHLTQNLPGQTETFFSIIEGKAFQHSPGVPPVRLDRDPEVLAEASAATEPTIFTHKTDVGPVQVATIPVEEADGKRGAFVIVQFLNEAHAGVNRTITQMSIISLIALGMAAGIGWIVAGRVLAPIRTVRETADSIGEGDLSRRIEVTGRDDVAQLAITFNRMLDRLETAFEGQRKFLDDAGHELRTPITVVRGHLELMGDDPQERAVTLRLVNDELARMARLVDDLTLLARSERPDFLHPQPVVMSDLIVDALTHATTLGNRDFKIAELPEDIVVADGQRLLQAIMQLVANAIKYTVDGDSISIGAAVVPLQTTSMAIIGGGPVGGSHKKFEQSRHPQHQSLTFEDGTAEYTNQTVKIWVTDTGSGISDDDKDKLFERFNRGSKPHAASQSVDLGLGIGLEIVARIANAHAGTVSVQSVVGIGSTFTIEIPHFKPEP